MAVKLATNKHPNPIPMYDLLDGQIAIIVDERYGYQGTIIQRYGDRCISLGKAYPAGWSALESVTLLVRVLQAGELIEIV